MLLEPRHELDEIAGAVAVVELRPQYLPAIAAGAGRAGQREKIGPAGDAAVARLCMVDVPTFS